VTRVILGAIEDKKLLHAKLGDSTENNFII
jgi:hypothetical protein